MARLADDDSDALTLDIGAEIIGATIANRPQLGDVYLRIELDRLPRAAGPAFVPGHPGVMYGARFRAAGIRYEVRAGLVGSIPRFGLFRCEERCAQIATLLGGYGTTGEEIVTAIPTAYLGGATYTQLNDLRVFSGFGHFATGALDILDEAG